MSSMLPVVFVPGMLCDADLWSSVQARLDVPAIDAEVNAASIGGMAEQVLASVDGRFVLAGLSLGAIVGFEVLRRAPQRVAGFCAISTNAGAPSVGQYQAWRAMANRTARGEFTDLVRDTILPTMFASAEPPPHRAERFLAMAHRVGPRAFRAQLTAQASRVDAVASLRAVRCPTLVISGQADALCPPSFHHTIAESITGSRLEYLPGAGHLCTWERPDAAAAVLRDWLRATTPTDTTTLELTCPLH
jgi:pimeloyl-ACP methyl ester carboxylesterase